MKKPTKAQRHAIYKKALERFDTHPNYLCLVIYKAGGEEYWCYSDEMPMLFPEFAACKPRTATYSWWGHLMDSGITARRRALLKMIKMSAPKPKK